MRCKNLLAFIFAVILISSVSASFSLSESGTLIKKEYGISDYLEADLNISFFNQPLNSVFRDSFGNEMSLENLLSGASNYIYVYYDIENTAISSAYQILTFTGTGFELPSTEGNFPYQLNISDEIVFEEVFEIKPLDNSVRGILNQKYSELNKTKTKIAEFDLFAQEVIIRFSNITLIESTLQELEIKYENSETSQEQAEILNNLSQIRFPVLISRTVNVNPMTFYPDLDKINLDILGEIAGGTYTNKEKYLDMVLFWNMKNLPTILTYNNIHIKYIEEEEYDLGVFRFVFDKRNLMEDAYFIIEKIENLKFEGLPYGVAETNNYMYVNIRSIADTLTISTTEDINFFDLPAFISPSLGNLQSMEDSGNYEEWKKKPKWALFAIIITLVLLISVVLFVLIQMWYRRRYEAHLFKTKNNMYNIMTYIHNAKIKGIPKEEIIKHLKKASWTGEQINYALRKYENKKIRGMIHTPLNIDSEETKNKPQKKK